MSMRLFGALSIVTMSFLGVRPASAVPLLTFNTPALPAGLTLTIESATQTTDLFAGDGNPNDTYLVTLRLVTTTSYVDVGTTNYLQAIGIDFGGTLDDGLLTNSPAGITWTNSLNIGVNGSAACGGTVAGSICDEDPSTGAPNLQLKLNATYDFIFKIDLPSTGFGAETSVTLGISTIEDNGQFKKIDNPITYTAGQIVPTGSGNNGETTAPEPASLLLVGSGAVLLASRARRRFASRR